MKYELNNSNYTFTAKANKKYIFDLFGACGASSSGGYGGHVQAVYQSETDTTLYIYVGGSPTDDYCRIGGYNGGGDGGLGGGTDPLGNSSHGDGGGGATDIRLGGTDLSNRILVAGGGGGGYKAGNGGQYPNTSTDGHPVPPDPYYNSFITSGGCRGTLSSGGVGGTAPSLAGDWDESNSGTFYYIGGGGGGGGYYGGGGGSTGVLNGKTGSSYTGAGGSAGSLGKGGAGGSKTSGVSAITPDGTPGSGGGGSSYIANIPELSCGLYDQAVNKSYPYHGYAYVHEVISAPIIRNVWKDGDVIHATISKEQVDGNEGIQEIFYYDFSLDDELKEIVKNPNNSIVISNSSEEIEIKYTIPTSTTTGEHIFYLNVCSGDNKTDKYSLPFIWNDLVPNVEFNSDILNKTLIQGSNVNKFFKATGFISGGESLIYEYKLIINGQGFKSIQKSTSTSIYLPFMYDGMNNSKYNLKVKVRVGQMSFGVNGIGRELWSNWFESEEFTVFAPMIPLNKIKFTNKLSDKAIEQDTKLKLSWEIDENFLVSRSDNIEYILYLFKDNKLLLEENCGKNMEKEIIMCYPQGEGYKFGISIANNGMFISDINFSDVFQIANISTDKKVVLSDNLDLTTSITDMFYKIEIIINNEIDFISYENINTSIPNWKLKNGYNLVEVKIYVNETIYTKHAFEVYLHTIKENISNVDTHIFDVNVSINNESNFTKVSPTKDSYVVNIGESENEFETFINENIVDEITQKITIKKINNEINYDLKLIEIVGGLG